MRPRAAAWLAGACLLLAAPPAAAQDATLARIDTLIATTRLTEARTTLDRWLASPAGRNRGGDVAAHALLLRGQLTTSADTALPLYLELALNHPASRFAPDALLRLGQGYLALGETERAEGYLHRLGRDYPTYTQRPVALLWLARAQFARRRTSDACATLDRALDNATLAADLRALLQQERTRCDAAPAPATAPPANRPANNAPGSAARSAGNYTVQVGAFRDPAAAQALARRLRSRDIDARVVHVGSGTLHMVRAGRFTSSNDAADLLRRVRTVVPDAVIASDVARERALTR